MASLHIFLKKLGAKAHPFRTKAIADAIWTKRDKTTGKFIDPPN